MSTRPIRNLRSSTAAATASKTERLNETETRQNFRTVSWLEKLLEPVLKDHVSLDRKVILSLESVATSAPSSLITKFSSGNALGDQLALKLPYADCYLHCWLSFCWLDPSIPPELIRIRRVETNGVVSEDDFVERFTLGYLAHFDWNPNENRFCLLNLVRLILHTYRLYQRDLCQQYDERLKEEIRKLEEPQFHIETYLHNTESKRKTGDVVTIFTRFQICFLDNKIPLASEGDKEFSITVKLRSFEYENNRSTVKVELSDFLKQLLRDETSNFPPAVGSVMKTVKFIKIDVETRVIVAMEAVMFNRQLIQKVLECLSTGSNEGCLIDYESRFFGKATFLSKTEDGNYILKIEFPLKYPQKVIKVQAQSTFHEVSATYSRIKKPCFFQEHLPVVHIKMEFIFPDLEKVIQRTIANLKEKENAAREKNTYSLLSTMCFR